MFQRFIAASGVTNLADGIAGVVWAWLASMLTRDPLLIALVPIALRLPWFLCAIPAGIVTDRMDRRILILGMDVARAVAFAGAALAVWRALPLASPPVVGVADPVLFGVLLLAALVVGAAEVFRDNAAQTMLPALVPHDGLERANGLLSSVELVGNSMVGPLLGAFLLALGAPLPFVVNAFAFGIAVRLVFGLRGRFQAEVAFDRNWRREFEEGLRFLRQAPMLRLLAWLTGFWNLLFQMVMIALVLHAQDDLGLGPVGYALILTEGAVGGILGGLMASRIIRRFGPGRTAQWMLASAVPAFLGMALAPGPITLGLALAVFEFTGLVWNSASISYRQRVIPDQLLGRVNGLYRLLAWGMMPVGLLLSGMIARGAETVLSHHHALIAPFIVAATGALVLTLIGWRPLGRGFRPGA